MADAPRTVFDARQLDCKNAAHSLALALGESLAAVFADDGSDDEESQPRAFDPRRDPAGRAVETFEYPLQLAMGNAHAAVGHAHRDPPVVNGRDLDRHVDPPVGIFDRVVDQVRYGRA